MLFALLDTSWQVSLIVITMIAKGTYLIVMLPPLVAYGILGGIRDIVGLELARFERTIQSLFVEYDLSWDAPMGQFVRG